MSDEAEIWERPQADELYMIAGWRQWADAGSTSSALPEYLIDQNEARQIGIIRPDGFYLFQIPGTHGLVRPVVRFEDGYPAELEERRNELYYTGDARRGVVIFLGDEPHLDIDRYTEAFLHAAQTLGVKRIVGLGGVYGELPYNKERMVSSIFSLPRLKTELKRLAVNFSDYHGGASIGSYICRKAGDKGMEYVSLYAFVPTYDFSGISQIGNTIRVENDFMAWRGIMQRINYMLKTDFDLADLEERSQQLIEVLDAKVDQLHSLAPQLGVHEYMARLAEGFNEVLFEPLDDVWEEELRRLFDDSDDDES
jgi:proteasome assembly chaperone (PAC2) family protein